MTFHKFSLTEQALLHCREHVFLLAFSKLLLYERAIWDREEDDALGDGILYFNGELRKFVDPFLEFQVD